MHYDASGVPCTLMRGGTSKAAYFLAQDLPTDRAERDDLLLRLMGSPDERQIDGLGGATSLTSKVAVLSPGDPAVADVDYLFLQVSVDRADVSSTQNCGNVLAGVGAFAVEKGLVAAADPWTSVRVLMVNTGSVAVLTVPTPAGRTDYRGSTAIAGVPGTAAPVTIAFSRTEGSTTGSLFPTGRLRDCIDGIDVTCIDNGMPVVVVEAASLGLAGDETHAGLDADEALISRVDAMRIKAGELMGLGDVTHSSVPKTAVVAPGRDGGDISIRSFIPVRPHAAVGVLTAISVVTAVLVDGTVGAPIGRAWRTGISRVDVEHPSGHLLVDVAVDSSGPQPVVVRSGVVRTARKLFEGRAYPRARPAPSVTDPRSDEPHRRST